MPATIQPIPFKLFWKDVGPHTLLTEQIDGRDESELLRIMHAEPNPMLAILVASIYYRFRPVEIFSLHTLRTVLGERSKQGDLFEALILLLLTPHRGCALKVIQALDPVLYQPYYAQIERTIRRAGLKHELYGWLHEIKRGASGVARAAA